MKTKEILMIHCLVLLGIALIASLFKKVPGIVKNGSFFIAIVLLAVSQVLDETENMTPCTSDPSSCCDTQLDWCVGSSNTLGSCTNDDNDYTMAYKCCVNQRGCGNIAKHQESTDGEIYPEKELCDTWNKYFNDPKLRQYIPQDAWACPSGLTEVTIQCPESDADIYNLIDGARCDNPSYNDCKTNCCKKQSSHCTKFACALNFWDKQGCINQCLKDRGCS